MDLEALIRSHHEELTSRLAFALSGDRHAAEDLAQEAFTRAWRSLPDGLSPERQRAWLKRTSRNLAVDELRRRSRRPTVALDDDAAVGRTVQDAAAPDAAREALAGLPAHQRFVLLLHYDAGFNHGEIARLLDTTEEAARKRVSRAKTAFLRAYRQTREDSSPLILLVSRDDPTPPYVRWLQNAGARVRHLTQTPSQRELSLSDGMVLTGAFTDLHAGLYGEVPRIARGEPDFERDRIDLGVLTAALAMDLPVLGVCRGHQLLNIASGGDLYQDVVGDGATTVEHGAGAHPVRTHAGAAMRSLLGRSTYVDSEHHQAIRRVGRGLKATATSPDGVVESIERTDRRFALGLQWHPERDPGGSGDRIAEALVQAAVDRAA
ncbi:MAG TPA: sigma-70 family RNA polymerase sigma factor [Solirubrobacteraceae bacterium]|jgi:anthranilate synthase component 2/putative glutamine amidotransferase|nr:sigma-70 family RNA polymerase sigma factor [Solirubrobacteraceae bacterium]